MKFPKGPESTPTWFTKLVRILEVEPNSDKSTAEQFLTNSDLAPVEQKRRTWRSRNFVAFWISDAFNINTWMIASSYVAAGLTWWECWLAVWVGYFIVGGFIVASGRVGAKYHISFPVWCRSSYGIWGSLWPVFNRAAMACIWYGVQSWIGGECVSLMILSIWPQARNMKNTIPESTGATTFSFVSFFLFWIGSLPAIWFPVHQIRHLFTVKSFLMPVAAIGFLAWTCARAHGIGPIVHQKSNLHGSDKAWTWIQAMMSCIANFATLIVNDPDFSRFSVKPKSAIWSQLFTIPLAFGITAFVGVIVSSSSTIFFGETLWNPLEVLKMFLELGVNGKNSNASAGARTGVFLISACFTLAQLGTNIAANSVSAGTDMTALCPRFLNIRRGGYICAMVGLAMCPWNLMKSSNNFTSYLSSYSVFLSSIAGVMMSDYYFVRRGRLIVSDLYIAKKGSTYMFDYGFSWRGYAAYIAGILINVVGFAGDVGNEVPIGATYIYRINYFCGWIIAAATYYLLCRFWPIPEMSKVWDESLADLVDYETEGEITHARTTGSDSDSTSEFVSEEHVYPKNSVEKV